VSSSGLPAITTSWDDGHPLDLRLADLLAKHNVPATFYIPRENGRERLPDSAIRTLASRFEIGAHTLTHADLSRLSAADARREIMESKDWVEQVTSKRCSVFCFPMGRFRPNQLRFVREAGYAGARTVELLALHPPRQKHGVLLLPTTLQAYSHSAASYFRNLVKRAAVGSFANLTWCMFARKWSEAAGPLLSRALAAHGVFHLWGHSWEIEALGQWAVLENVLQGLGEQARNTRTLTNGELCSSIDSAPL
jgi:peptidoglycan/xylan/chitin deacetylase (PgdA/CDA1 family)